MADTTTFKPTEEQRMASKLAALRALIDEGDQSGVSERSVDDIMHFRPYILLDPCQIQIQ